MRSVKISKDFDMSCTREESLRVRKVVFSRVENVILSTTNVVFYKKAAVKYDVNNNLLMKKEVL